MNYSDNINNISYSMETLSILEESDISMYRLSHKINKNKTHSMSKFFDKNKLYKSKTCNNLVDYIKKYKVT